jgi:hypothetical protein
MNIKEIRERRERWKIWDLHKQQWLEGVILPTRIEAERWIVGLTKGRRNQRANFIRLRLVPLRESDTKGRAACQKDWDQIEP